MASTSSSAPHQSEISYAFDELAPPSASTSSSPLKKLHWDVFINHRGPDVKNTLARAIFDALHASGLKVFLDTEGLQSGVYFPKELQEAMTGASLHVAIFSPTYAQSPWCLAELSFMLKTGNPIIPVFYHVQPADLRHLVHGKGIYAASFWEHQEKRRYSIDKLEEWKMALHRVSFYTGQIINNNDEEQRVLKNIVNQVLGVMKIEPLKVAKHPVGLEEVVAYFEMVLNKSVKVHSNVQIVGIWGMGGLGKTTLAIELYNRKCKFLEKSCFLFDVREAKSELHKKQMKLLHDLGFQGKPFDNVEQGKGILSNYLRSVSVLIILDDVDHIDQLEALLPAKDSLGWGSLIIVTTRERDVLRCWDISAIYDMKPMNQSHAKQLFCLHAFSRPYPPPGFQELVEDFVSACNGLPLSLKVLGGQLHGCSSKDYWRTLLHKISRILPQDIINRLRVSYDALDEEEKQMFLDAAFFFNGKDKMMAFAVWDESGWGGLYGLEMLVNKCLVDLDDNIIRMHDHLRDLASEIAKTERLCCLWSPNQNTGFQNQTEVWFNTSFSMLSQIMQWKRFFGLSLCPFVCLSPFILSLLILLFSIQIRGMLLNGTASGVHNFPAQLHGLKIFVVGENYGKYLHIVKSATELAMLSCTGIVNRILPSWLPVKNLRVLELHDCQNIVSLWKEEELSQPTDYSQWERVPRVNKQRVAPTLYGRRWKDGAEPPKQLRVLIISNCPNLARIPKSIGFLKNLTEISVFYCKVENLPEEFCSLHSLEHLQLISCTMLSSLPSYFGRLRSLQRLSLIDCGALKILPDSFKLLTLLEDLQLANCEMLNLEVQSLPFNLRTLGIIDCPLSRLDFGRGPFTCSLSKLKGIYLWSTKVSRISISGDCCPGLQTLRIRDDEHLTKVDTLPTAVEDILVDRCKLLRNISGIGGLVNLRELRLFECPELDTCPSFDNLVNLQKLQIFNCPELDTLPSFDKLASLEVFELRGGNKVEKIQGLQHCTSLEWLEIDCKCWEVPGIESLEHLQRLRSLQLVAKKRSIVETCIQTIQKWPEEIIICTKAVAGAGSLLNSSAFPSLSVVNAFGNDKLNSKPLVSLSPSNGNAMMLCLVINCLSPRLTLIIEREYHVEDKCNTEMEEGKWILIGVFTQHSLCLTAQNFYIWEWPPEDNEVEKGMIVRGEEDSVVEAFHHLLPLLAN